MTSEKPRSGGEHLERRSDTLRSNTALDHVRDILIVEDEARDSDRLKATLRLMAGYDALQLRVAPTVSTAVDAILERAPQVVLLDDHLKPSDTAFDTIPFLKRAGYADPILVISGEVTRRRRVALLEAGATDVVHKDDVDSVKLIECLNRVVADRSQDPE